VLPEIKIKVNTMQNALPVNNQYEQLLATQNEALKQKRLDKALSPITQLQKTTLNYAGLPPSCNRGIEYLFNEQGSRTDHIAASCAIGNVSDAFIGLEGANTQRLSLIGLKVDCQRVSAKNRFNRRTCIGIWWLSIIDADLWKQAQNRTASIIGAQSQ